jgi:hypothetical protein
LSTTSSAAFEVAEALAVREGVSLAQARASLRATVDSETGPFVETFLS